MRRLYIASCCGAISARLPLGLPAGGIALSVLMILIHNRHKRAVMRDNRSYRTFWESDMTATPESSPQTPAGKEPATRRIFVTPTERLLKALGRRISAARRDRRLKQSELAEKAGISESTYRRMEKGDGSVSVGAFMRVLEILGALGSVNAILLPMNDRTGKDVAEERLPTRVRGKAHRPKGR